LKQIWTKKRYYFSRSITLGVVIFSILSILQKTALGIDPFTFKALIVPIIIGGVSGAFVGSILFKNMKLIQKLEIANASLDEQVKMRTKELNDKNKKLEEMSNTDGLTSVANRRHFDSFLSAECKRVSRSGSDLSLIMCDIDYFKIFNDTYGHQTGDECLKSVANVLAGVEKRQSDLIARYGGEEFAIVLPDTDLEMAIQLAEKSRKAIEQLAIPHETEEHGNIVTMSFGVASIIKGGGNKNCSLKLISIADKALYAAKKNGRNKVVHL